MNGKNQYWQVVRGICILAVIMIHCPTGQGYSNIDYNIWMVLRQVINFPVAIFIFLAGYFVNSEKVKQNLLLYIANRGGVRLLVPYLIWSVVYLIKTAIVSGFSSAYDIFLTLLTGGAAVPFYYIIVLLQLTILTPLLVYKRHWSFYLITPIYLIFIYIYRFTANNNFQYFGTLFPNWIIFYILGMDCRAGKLDKLINKVNVFWIFGCLLLSIGEAYLLLTLGQSDTFASSQVKFSSFIYVVVIALWLQKHYKVCNGNIFSSIGDCSYGIFYIHMLIISLLHKAFEYLNLGDIWLIYFILVFLITTVLSYLIVLSVRTLAKKCKCEKALKFIGF
jgi:surface polysaccharide O-acyltransferase-like enzyme